MIMKKINKVSLLFLVTSLCLTNEGFAVTYTDGDYTASFDSTLSLGATVRTSHQDSRVIGIFNGGSAPSINGDDGDLNYSRGFTAAAFKALHEINLDYKNEFGNFVRFTYFMDAHNIGKDDLTRTAKNRVGRDIELLDAYQYINGNSPWDQSVSLKVGNQALNWGESTFIRNGINSINPVDANKIRVPGSEVRDALLPFPVVDLNVGVTDNLSLEGFYQFYWKETEPEAAGTFFSTSDISSPGANRVYLGFGTTNTSFVKRGPSVEPRHHDQFGFALRYFSPWLNNTEFGLYYTDYHSRLPVISSKAGPSALTIVQDSSYFLEYPEHIKTFGASFNTEISTLGLSWQGEASYKKDHPLQIHSIELLQASLSPLSFFALGGGAPAAAALSTNQILQDLGINSGAGINSLLGQDIKGYRRYDVLTGQTTATKLFGPTLKADQFVLIGEAGFNYITDMPKKTRLRLDAPATYLGGNSTLAGAEGVQLAKTFPTSFSWGYVLGTRLEYLDAFWGVNLYPKASFKHDVQGITPNPLGTFREHRKSISLGLDATWQNRWEFSFQYTNFFGAGRYNLLRDRDHISAELKFLF